METWTELESLRLTIKNLTEDNIFLKEETDRFAHALSQQEQMRANDEEEDKQILARDRQINELKCTIAALEAQSVESNANITKYQKKILQLESRLARAENGAEVHQHNIELQDEIMNLQVTVDEWKIRNEELSKELKRKSIDLECKERSMREQSNVLKVRDELIMLLKERESETKKSIQRMREDYDEKVEMVQKEITAKAEELHTLFSTLEMKQVQVARLEKIVKSLEEQQTRGQAQRTRYEERIAMMESELAEYKTKSGPKYVEARPQHRLDRNNEFNINPELQTIRRPSVLFNERSMEQERDIPQEPMSNDIYQIPHLSRVPTMEISNRISQQATRHDIAHILNLQQPRCNPVVSRPMIQIPTFTPTVVFNIPQGHPNQRPRHHRPHSPVRNLIQEHRMQMPAPQANPFNIVYQNPRFSPPRNTACAGDCVPNNIMTAPQMMNAELRFVEAVRRVPNNNNRPSIRRNRGNLVMGNASRVSHNLQIPYSIHHRSTQTDRITNYEEEMRHNHRMRYSHQQVVPYRRSAISRRYSVATSALQEPTSTTSEDLTENNNETYQNHNADPSVLQNFRRRDNLIQVRKYSV